MTRSLFEPGRSAVDWYAYNLELCIYTCPIVTLTMCHNHCGCYCKMMIILIGVFNETENGGSSCDCRICDTCESYQPSAIIIYASGPISTQIVKARTALIIRSHAYQYPDIHIQCILL